MSGCSPQSSFLPLALCFLALLGLILSLLSLTVAITHSTGASASKFFVTSLVILFMVTPTTGFILPLQSPELFQVSAMISLPFSLANFVSLAVASH